jgi:hypothetical protein
MRRKLDESLWYAICAVLCTRHLPITLLRRRFEELVYIFTVSVHYAECTARVSGLSLSRPQCEFIFPVSVTCHGNGLSAFPNSLFATPLPVTGTYVHHYHKVVDNTIMVKG